MRIPRKLSQTTFKKRCQGLTLIELLVTVSLVAILATVAVQSTGGLVTQSRFTLNSNTLKSLEDAILGPSSSTGLLEPDGTLLVKGFVADVGRLPRSRDFANQPSALSELWQRFGLSPYSLQQAPSDSDVRLFAGWRGPYIQLSAGATGLLDGWGHPFIVAAQNGSPTSPLLPVNQPIEIIISLGSDNAPGATADPNTQDLILPLIANGSQPGISAVNKVQASVSGYIQVPPGLGSLTNQVSVYYFAPNPDGPGLSEFDVQANYVGADQYFYSMAGLTIGPRVLRAYFDPSGGVPDPALATTLRSDVVPVMLAAGGQTKNLQVN